MFLNVLIKFIRRNEPNFRRNFHKSRHLNGYFLSDSPNSEINKSIYDRYMCLPLPESKIQATYVWIDSSGVNLRSKTMTVNASFSTFKEAPQWRFNGAPTGQATETDSECHLIPVAVYDDPIRRGKNKLVLCEVFGPDEKPDKRNHRQKCVELLNGCCDQEPMFRFEQEYLLMGACGAPFGWPMGMEPGYTSSYCQVGARNVYGREIDECFYRACLYSGIGITSSKAELMKGQWEFKIGPFPNIKAADDLWMGRWLLTRIAEDFGIGVGFTPKYSPGWPGSGLHVSFSTKRMRDDNGYKHIEEAIKKLEKTHKEDLRSFDPSEGKENAGRLVGKFLAPKAEKLNFGVGDRTVSIKISKDTALKKKGSFEDRRPGANADPYMLISTLIKSAVK